MYDTHYGLTGRPFQLTPDPRFWFDTATHKKAMAYLGYGLSQGEGFIVITGDIGAGKTTLVGHLTDGIDPARLNVIKIVSTQIASDELLHVVCAGLDVDAAGLNKAQMLGAIERGLHAVARGGRRTLLIVDEAQALPVDSLEELRMLSNFQSGGHALLQIFLLGQPEFRDKLNDDGLEQLRQRVIAMHHLGPMEAEELEPYLIHRLNVVGWQGRPDFTIDAIETIYAWSGGIPRRINQLVSRVLLHGAIEGIDTFSADDVMTVVTDLGGDGMTGGAVPNAAEPRLDFEPPAPVAVPAVRAEPEPVAVAAEPLPIAVDDDADEQPVIEWPFVVETAEAEVDAESDTGATWRPIAADEQDDAPLPIQVDSDVPEVDDAPVETADDTDDTDDTDVVENADDDDGDAVAEPRTVEISAPPMLGDPVAPTGRGSILAPVDPAPKLEQARDSLEFAALTARVAEIERRMEDQDAALRRVLTLLVDWVEGGSRPEFASQDLSGEHFPGYREELG